MGNDTVFEARLMPPVFDGRNRAMYYAAMEYAMAHGRYAPLIRLFYEASQHVNLLLRDCVKSMAKP